MKLCHVCAAECADDAELCPICGAELLPEAEEEAKVAEEVLLENPVLAVSVEDVVTGEIYRDMLRENGIPFTCDELENSMKLVFGGGFVAEDIYVAESDLDEALRIYNEVLNAEPAFDDSFFEELGEDAESAEESEEE